MITFWRDNDFWKFLCSSCHTLKIKSISINSLSISLFIHLFAFYETDHSLCVLFFLNRSTLRANFMQCRYCKYNCASQNLLLRHYRLKHWRPGRREPLLCLYPECVCSFKTPGGLKTHLYRVRTNSDKTTVQATLWLSQCLYRKKLYQASGYTSEKVL